MKRVTRILSLVCMLLFIMVGVAYAEVTENLSDIPVFYSVRGKVIEVVDVDLTDGGLNADELIFDTLQKVKVLITSGQYNGEIVDVENYIGGNPITDIEVAAGQRVILSIDESSDGSKNVYINSYERDIAIYVLIGVFMLCIVLVGKLKGIKTIITLVITMAVVFLFTVPIILKGYNPVVISIISCVFITVVTILTISGLNKKSYAAIISTALGVILAGLLAYVTGYFAKLTGLDLTEGNMLLYIPQGIEFDFRELLFAGIIIGTLGATMDICMSVSSSMYEVKLHNPEIATKEWLRSGLRVGEDVMGTMTNTLILAYTGSSLAILLVFMAYSTPVLDIMNLDVIATEIVRSVAGSTGIVLSVPITSYIVILLDRINKK